MSVALGLLAASVALPTLVKGAGKIAGNIATRKDFKEQLRENEADRRRAALNQNGITLGQRNKMLAQAKSAMRGGENSAPTANTGLTSGTDLQDAQMKENARAAALGNLSQNIDAASQQQTEQRNAASQSQRIALQQQKAARWASSVQPIADAGAAAGSMALQSKAQAMDPEKWNEMIAMQRDMNAAKNGTYSTSSTASSGVSR